MRVSCEHSVPTQECETIMASLWAGIAGANGIEFQRQNFNIPWPVGSVSFLSQSYLFVQIYSYISERIPGTVQEPAGVVRA
jgi:hypothetical protein